MGRSKTPREFVTTTELLTSSGNMSGSTPALAMCTHSSRSACGQARTTAVERKSHTNSASAPSTAAGSSSAVA
jgi:hypothetical protein